jgi:hypothetical protein
MCGTRRLDAEATRERQVQALTDLDSRHRQALPSVIAGDFNAAPEASSIHYLTGQQSIGGRSVCYHDAWPLPGRAPAIPWTDENPNAAGVMEQIVRQPGHRRRMDYVFVGSCHGPRTRTLARLSGTRCSVSPRRRATSGRAITLAWLSISISTHRGAHEAGVARRISPAGNGKATLKHLNPYAGTPDSDPVCPAAVPGVLFRYGSGRSKD